ncbi:MAG: alcohol dehydrogenase [Candidatus Schekmanbacteria bacterium]|nr:MAG: alcohol dehydrogenase [Candidatus Schekmanbacteria bacterium]
MKALYFNGEKIHYKKNYPVGKPSKAEALVRILKAGICNTDIEIVKGYMGFEGILGHEFVGIVEECNEKRLIGKRVCGEINLSCGECEYCRKKLENHCPSRKVLGILNKDGCFAEFITLPIKNLHTLPKNVSDNEAVFVEPLAACFEVLKQIRIEKDDVVAVIGDGKLGLLMVQVVGQKTRNIHLIGRHRRNLNIAKRFDLLSVFLENSLKAERLKKTKCDIVIDCTGTPAGLSLSMELVKPCGKIVLKSTYASAQPLNLAPVVINEITLIGSRCGPFKDAINALKVGKVDVLPLISKDFHLSEGLEAIEYAKQKGVMKVILSVAQ